MHSFDIVIEHEGRSASLLVVQAHRGETLGAVLESVRKRGIGSDGVVVRMPVDMPMDPAQLAADDPADAAVAAFLGPPNSRFRRAQDRSVHVLTSQGGQPYLTQSINPRHPLDRVTALGLEPGDLLDRIRKREMTVLVDRSRALLTAPPGAVFRAPSGHLVANFIRVGNVQRDRDAVDALFFWMLPHLRGVDAVLVDTWSISSLGFHAGRAAATYFGRGDVPVEMLGAYVEGAGPSIEEARDALKRLLLAIDKPGIEPRNVLVLISATQSGALARRLRAVELDVGPSLASSYLALFGLGPIEFPRLADLAHDERFRLLDPDPAKGVLEIDAQVYFPLAFADVPVRLSMLDAKRHRDFFDAYRGTGLIRVHCEDDRADGTGGHRAIRLDLDAIVDHRRFAERLRALLCDAPVPRAILAPGHVQAQSLAARVSDHFRRAGTEVPIMPTLTGSNPADDPRQRDLRRLLAACGPEDGIVVVDDVCGTTAALALVDKQLRTERYDGHVHYLVGIGHSADQEEWSDFARRLSQRGGSKPHMINCVESVPLPDWDADRCPWCRELALYNRWIERGHTLPGQLDRRRQALTTRSSGDLDQRAFLHPDGLDLPELGDRSFFVLAPCTQSEVFAATAAALQTLRSGSDTGQPRLAERHFPVAKPLDDQDYLEQKWTDTVIRASILRAATRDELVWTDPEREAERSRRMRKLLTHPEPHEHDVRLEILLSACLGKATLNATGGALTDVAVDDDGTTAFLIARLAELGQAPQDR